MGPIFLALSDQIGASHLHSETCLDQVNAVDGAALNHCFRGGSPKQ